ncbi:MAG: hypothetical protein WC761_00220 [Candidatus Paceibacterota bacterium]|jgi:hypothetical protein
MNDNHMMNIFIEETVVPGMLLYYHVNEKHYAQARHPRVHGVKQDNGTIIYRLTNGLDGPKKVSVLIDNGTPLLLVQRSMNHYAVVLCEEDLLMVGFDCLALSPSGENIDTLYKAALERDLQEAFAEENYNKDRNSFRF